MVNLDWNHEAINNGLKISHADKIFASNHEYSSKYHGVNQNLRSYGDIFQRCYNPKTRRMGNRSSQDLLKIAKIEEKDWDQNLKWYSRCTDITKPICFLCGKTIYKKSDIQSEHIIPFATAVKVGVINNSKNYAPAHAQCNNLKDNKLSLAISDKEYKPDILQKGDFNDLAQGYRSILTRTENIDTDPENLVVIDLETRLSFLMYRILSALTDYESLEPEDQQILEKRIEIMDTLAEWFMKQKIIKGAIVDADLKTINKLVNASDQEVKAKYYGLKWKHTVLDNKEVVSLQKKIDEQSQKNRRIGTQT